MRSARKAVRKWRRGMQRKCGDNWLAKVREMFERDHPNWTHAVCQIFDRHGRVAVEFVMFARGGFEGERIRETAPGADNPP